MEFVMPESNLVQAEYGASGSRQSLSDEFKTDFWEHVKRALREVFAADDALVAPLRAAVDRTAPEMQSDFYDVEPFAVAVDLSKALYRQQ
jgi:hypothetical protein